MRAEVPLTVSKEALISCSRRSDKAKNETKDVIDTVVVELQKWLTSQPRGSIMLRLESGWENLGSQYGWIPPVNCGFLD